MELAHVNRLNGRTKPSSQCAVLGLHAAEAATHVVKRHDAETRDAELVDEETRSDGAGSTPKGPAQEGRGCETEAEGMRERDGFWGHARPSIGRPAGLCRMGPGDFAVLYIKKPRRGQYALS